MAQTVKNLLAVQETWVAPLGRKDNLEGKVAARSSVLAWRIPWTEEPGGLQSMVSQRAGHHRVSLALFTILSPCFIVLMLIFETLPFLFGVFDYSRQSQRFHSSFSCCLVYGKSQSDFIKTSSY